MNGSFRFHDWRFGGYSHQFKLKKKHSYYGGKAHWPGKPRPGKPLWGGGHGHGHGHHDDCDGEPASK